MAFSIFNESFYLAANPDVGAAVRAGVFPSGLAHFQTVGLNEGRTTVSPFFSEADYRRRHPDVDAAVRSGGLVSGLQHFILSGETEGRPFNDYFSEGSYLARNPDVANVVRSGVFASGLAHYLKHGRLEGRSIGSFNEFYYARDRDRGNRDVGIFINEDRLFNGFEHYEKAGKFEGRIGRFGGTSGNDLVVATGARTEISGVDSRVLDCGLGGTSTGGQCVDWFNLGIAQIDTLIGSEGDDTFVASQFSRGKVTFGPIPFYQNAGNNDYMRIEQFDPDHDRLLLGAVAIDYTMIPIEDRLEIYRNTTSSSAFSPTPKTPDLIAVIDNPNHLTFDLAKVVVTG